MQDHIYHYYYLLLLRDGPRLDGGTESDETSLDRLTLLSPVLFLALEVSHGTVVLRPRKDLRSLGAGVGGRDMLGFLVVVKVVIPVMKFFLQDLDRHTDDNEHGHTRDSLP